MSLVKFIDSSGAESEVSIDDGMSVMEGAIRAGIDGIDADCGGQLSCATCHVYVGEEWQDKVPAMSEDEDALLEFAADRRANSRLCCQILISSGKYFLVVEVPASQHACNVLSSPWHQVPVSQKSNYIGLRHSHVTKIIFRFRAGQANTRALNGLVMSAF